jgi:hypothetical protein
VTISSKSSLVKNKSKYLMGGASGGGASLGPGADECFGVGSDVLANHRHPKTSTGALRIQVSRGIIFDICDENRKAGFNSL